MHNILTKPYENVSWTHNNFEKPKKEGVTSQTTLLKPVQSWQIGHFNTFQYELFSRSSSIKIITNFLCVCSASSTWDTGCLHGRMSLYLFFLLLYSLSPSLVGKVPSIRYWLLCCLSIWNKEHGTQFIIYMYFSTHVLSFFNSKR